MYMCTSKLQAVLCQRLLMAVYNMPPRGRKAHGADRLVLLSLPLKSLPEAT